MESIGSLKVRSAYAGGYSVEIKNRLERIVIPEKVKCILCRKVKIQGAFSNKQLEDLRHAIFTDHINPTVTGAVRCRECVGGQRVELRCCICDMVKGLDQFAKAQRSHGDAARCLDCVQHHVEADPVVDEQKLLADTEHTSLHEPTVTASQIDARSFLGSLGSDDGGVSVAPEGLINQKNIQGSSRHHTSYAGSIHSGWASLGLTSHKAGSVDSPRTAARQSSNWARIPSRVKGEAASVRPLPVSTQTVPYEDDDEEAAAVDAFL
ncbi:Stc1 domain-containing protein [Aspergillus ambiguus]|uniref:Stc1 domain-containing protein n=1 Tax=Aspergillus ambiguus TaxID=176160 RepID=UPI003CCD4375